MAMAEEEVQQGLSLVLGNCADDGQNEDANAALTSEQSHSLSLRYRCANTSMHWWKMTGSAWRAASPSLAAAAYRRKWKTRESTHCHAAAFVPCQYHDA